MLTSLSLGPFLMLLLGAAAVFAVALWHLEATHRLPLSLMCLLGAGVYLAMAALDLIAHDAGSLALAAGLAGVSALASLWLRWRHADPWPRDTETDGSR